MNFKKEENKKYNIYKFSLQKLPPLLREDYMVDDHIGRGVALGDLDGDGDADVVFANRSGGAPNNYCVNDGSGRLTGPISIEWSRNRKRQV